MNIYFASFQKSRGVTIPPRKILGGHVPPPSPPPPGSPPMAFKIKSDPERKGITMFESVDVRILQFADDATIFVKDRNSLRKAVRQIE